MAEQRDRPRMTRARIGAVAVGLGLGWLALGCVTQADTYWTRGEASEKDFRLASSWCTEKAEDEGASMSTRSCTTTTAYGGGTYCQEEDPNDFENQQRRERKVSRSYAQCMQQRGWKSNTEGQGYKGVY